VRKAALRDLAATTVAKYQVINGKPKTLPASERLHAKLCFPTIAPVSPQKH